MKSFTSTVTRKDRTLYALIPKKLAERFNITTDTLVKVSIEVDNEPDE